MPTQGKGAGGISWPVIGFLLGLIPEGTGEVVPGKGQLFL